MEIQRIVMKKLLLLVVPLLIIFVGARLYKGSDDGFCHLTYQEFRKVKLKKAKILDVRTTDEYQQGHLKNAVNIDVLQSDFKENIEKLDKRGKYYVYCKSGKRSAKAAEIMTKEGFNNVCSIDGGILQMQKDGAQLVK